MKKVIIAIDSYKGCITSIEAGEAARKGVLQAYPDAQVTLLPVSDGGEGMLSAFTAALHGAFIELPVHDPLMRPIKSHYGISQDGKTAIIEMAQASGLTLVDENERDALHATTYGTGELIAHAIGQGCRNFIVGLGGSATTDAGMGMLRALGMDFGADMMGEAQYIDDEMFLPRYRDISITVASDVQNPLYGTDGAAYVYAPQKGASPRLVERLDQNLRHFAELMKKHTGQDYAATPGAGAAGGTGFALLATMNAILRPGTNLLLDLLNFDDLLSKADLVITGEGCADQQTLMGKLPYGILQRAKARQVATLLIAGRIANQNALTDAGFSDAVCINPPNSPLAECLIPSIAKQRIATCVAKTLQTI